MHYRIEHETRLDFPTPVHEHQCELRMSPRQNTDQRVNAHAIETDPPAELLSYIDSFGNHVEHFTLMAPHHYLITRVVCDVETTLENPFAYPLLMVDEEAGWLEHELKNDPLLWPYILHVSDSTPAWATVDQGLTPPVWDHTQPLQYSVLKAMAWIGDLLRYQTGSTTVDTPLSDVLKHRAGVCQDFAHAFISLLRHWGVPARYVMGYLDPGLVSDETLNGEQASHAWVEVLIPGAGWRGFDATHQLVADHTYIPVAVGRDTHDAAPQRGSFKGGHAGHLPRITLRIARQNQ